AEELVDQGRDRGLVQAGGPGDVGPREGRLLAQQVEDDGPVDGLDQRLVTGAEDQCPSSCGSVCGSVGSGSVRGPVSSPSRPPVRPVAPIIAEGAWRRGRGGAPPAWG